MDSITLSLRQRKILNLVQNHTSHITGQALARQLDVSVRTIRNDIVEINRALASYDASISAEKSKGYYLKCSSPITFQELFKTDDLLLTREDRIRYLIFQLCLTEVPLNQYDLEDEMYVSKTTLENDIASLKRLYVLSSPHIKLIHEGDTWAFEKDEAKRRALLNHQFHSDWNYNTSGNAYYSYNFLDSEFMSLIIQVTTETLLNYNFQLEDSNMVALNLALAIMYYRVRSGNTLPESQNFIETRDSVYYLCQDLFIKLEAALSYSFPPQEKEAIYEHLKSSELQDAAKLNFQTVDRYFSPQILEMANCYLNTIYDTFQLDFSADEDFYITLLQYLRYISGPNHVLASQGNVSLLRQSLLTDSEIAYLIQPIALQYLGYYLEESELLYLTFCISGALESYRQYHPELKMRTVICCHLNLPATWSMKRKLLGAFGNYMDVIALLPVYSRSTYNFSDTDLVITTVKKPITDNPNTQVLLVKPEISPQDYSRLQNIVSGNCLNFIFQKQTVSLSQLLIKANWHENIKITDRFSLIEHMAQDFIQSSLVPEAYIEDILRREATYTFCYQSGALFLYSLIPAAETQITVASFDHRILWNSNKIRLVIMGCFSSSDKPLLLKLLHEIYVERNNPEYYKQKRTKEEYLRFFSEPNV